MHLVDGVGVDVHQRAERAMALICVKALSNRFCSSAVSAR
jgi:hypothetical protein